MLQEGDGYDGSAFVADLLSIGGPHEEEAQERSEAVHVGTHGQRRGERSGQGRVVRWLLERGRVSPTTRKPGVLIVYMAHLG